MHARRLGHSTLAITVVMAGSADHPTAQQQAFLDAFEKGDGLTEHSVTTAEGVGANIGERRVVTRFPRADLDGANRKGQPLSNPRRWCKCYRLHRVPQCTLCHGAGDIAMNVVVDREHAGASVPLS